MSSKRKKRTKKFVTTTKDEQSIFDEDPPPVFSSSSSSSSSTGIHKGSTTTTVTMNRTGEEKLQKKPVEILLIHRPRRAVSHWWKTLEVTSFFITFLGGICSCIAVGRLQNSFVGECPLFGSLSIIRGANLTDIDFDHIVDVTWGLRTDCGFCKYVPMAGACFAVMLAALFLQCGTQGPESKAMSVNISWMLVAPTIPITLIFFILSCISLANTVSGLLFFCYSIIENSDTSLNITSCPQVYQLPFPYRSTYAPSSSQSDVDRYSNFLIAEIGASLHFVGWFFALFILLVRCYSHADFHVLSRKAGAAPGSKFKGSAPGAAGGGPSTSEYVPLIMHEETLM